MASDSSHHCLVLASPWPGVYGVQTDSARHFGQHWQGSFGLGPLRQGAQHSASGRGAVEAFAGDLITSNPGVVHDLDAGRLCCTLELYPVERGGRMSEQLSLEGFEARPTDRLFFAIYPDAATAARIALLAQQLRDLQGLRGKPLAAKRLHVTLHHLGDFAGLPPGLVASACAAAAAVEQPAFELGFDRAESFKGRPRNRPFVLRGAAGLAALVSFQRVLGNALQAAGLGACVTARFTPHLTLLYDDRLVAAQDIVPVGWFAQEFVLVHSLLGQTRHEPLARWALTA